MLFDQITPRIKLSFRATRDDVRGAVFGSGVAQLCRGVERTGSLNKAAKEMGMAYSKAWRIVKHTEEAFGVQLLDRNGAHGSTLTPAGRMVLAAYDELQDDLALYARERLGEIAGRIEADGAEGRDAQTAPSDMR